MIFSHFRKPKKYEKERKEIIGIYRKNYEVIDKIPDDENGKQPIIVKRHLSSEGYRIFEPKRGHLSEAEFKSIQRLSGTVFLVEANAGNSQELVYIINENGQTALSKHDYDFVVGEQGATKRLVENSIYQKHQIEKQPQKQPGEDN